VLILTKNRPLQSVIATLSRMRRKRILHAEQYKIPARKNSNGDRWDGFEMVDCLTANPPYGLFIGPA